MGTAMAHGSTPAAIRAKPKSTSLDPAERPFIQCMIGESYARLGDKDKAI
jgi:hypothetical protein